MELGPGTKVTPNVELVRPLRKGGMGTVWVAKHLTLDTEVAVKFVIEDKGDSKVRLTRFKREASIAAKLTSPHVVRTFDHGVMDNDKPFIVMELLSGETLTERLRRGDALTAHNVLVLMQQLGGVLKNAHRAGIVHRDLKPDNLFLIDSEYELFLKVLDFGIAKQTQVTDISVVTESGAMIGTPNYMSPEQLLGKDIDPRADLWAAAVIAFQCLTGELPFEGDTVAALCLAICHEPMPHKATELVDDMPPAIDDWFDKAFQKSRDDRFADAREMMNALETSMGDWVDAAGGSPLRTSKPSSTNSSDDEVAHAETQTIGGSSGDEARGRRAASVSTKETPTFGGSTSTLDGGGGRARRWGAVAAVGVVAALGLWLATSSSNGDSSADPTPAATGSATAGDTASEDSTAGADSAAATDPTPAASASATQPAIEPSASATASEPPKPKPKPVTVTPAPRPKPAAVMPPKPKGKPDYCATHGFIVTKEGHKVPKPECL